MSYIGDFTEDSTGLAHKFTTRNTTGAASALSSGLVDIYKGSSTTPTTAGVTLTSTFASVTGFNHIGIDLSSTTFYAANEEYFAMLSQGTVNSVPVAGEVVFSFSIENRYAGADLTSINNSTSALDNFSDQYDGTGVAGDTFPATQSQVSSIVNTGSAIHVLPIASPNGFTLTTGSEVGDEDRTHALDGVKHELSDDTGTLDAIYKFDIGGDAAPVGVTFTGTFNSANDSWAIEANTGTDSTPVWQQVGTLSGSGGSGNTVHPFDMFANQIVSDLAGIVQIRVNGTGLTSSSFDVDQVFVSKSDTSRSVGYAEGRIWINTNASNTSTESFVDGVADNPVSTLATAKTLSTNIGLGDFHIINGSAITLAESSDNESYFGDNWALALGGQSCVDIQVVGASVSGIGTASSGEMHFDGCDIDTVSGQSIHADFCGLSGTVTHTLAGDYNYHNCYSKFAGAGAPTFAKTAGQAITAQWRNWAGSITFSGLEATDVLTVGGTLGTIDLGTPAGAVEVEIRGTYKEITNVGSAVVNTDGAIKGVDVADTLADTNAIKVPTDKMVFSKANELDINTKSINDVTITGDGSSTPFNV